MKKLNKKNKNIKSNQENKSIHEEDLSEEEVEKITEKISQAELDLIIYEQELIEDELISLIDSNLAEIYKKLKREIISWNKQIELLPYLDYFIFSIHSKFLKISFENDKINLLLCFNENKPFDDNKDITKEIDEDENDEIIRLTFSLNSFDEIEYALFLIKQSYENNKANDLESFLAMILPQSKYF